jgi:acylpyruvate hydrolase
LAKSFKGSAVITEFQMEEITDPFWLTINGEKRQGGEVTQMIHAIPDQISYLSKMIPLMKGDILFTGTPKGVGPIQSGDALEMGIGAQSVKRLMAQ